MITHVRSSNYCIQYGPRSKIFSIFEKFCVFDMLNVFSVSSTEPPHVAVSPVMSEHFHQAAIELHCHAEGLPKPTVEWQFNDQTVEQGEKYYIHACK